MRRLLVIGAGSYGRAVAEVILATAEHRLIGFVDDRWPELLPIWSLPVVGRLADLHALRSMADTVALAIGDNRARQAASQSALAAGFELANVVHARAVVSPSALLGQGITIMAGAVIGTEVHVGDGAIVNAGAVVDHHAHIGGFAHLGIGSCVGGGATVEPQAWLRGGSTVQPGQRLAAEDSTLPVVGLRQ